MALAEFFERLTLTRRLVRSLERLADAQEQQTRLLARLVDRLAPATPTVSEDDLRTTGPSFSRDREQAQLAEWTDGFRDRIGREPTEAEIDEFLDELQEAETRRTEA